MYLLGKDQNDKTANNKIAKTIAINKKKVINTYIKAVKIILITTAVIHLSLVVLFQPPKLTEWVWENAFAYIKRKRNRERERRRKVGILKGREKVQN